MKQILVFLLAASLLFYIAGCDTAKEPVSSPLSSIKTYMDIPDITADEIDAIKILKTGRDKFTYGALLATEA